MCCNNLRNIVCVVDGLLEKAIANVWFPIFLHTSLQGSIIQDQFCIATFIQKIPGLFCVHLVPKQERRTFGIVHLHQQVFHLVRRLQNGFVKLQARQHNFIVFCNGFFQNPGQLFFFLRTVQKDHRGDGMFCSQFIDLGKIVCRCRNKTKKDAGSIFFRVDGALLLCKLRTNIVDLLLIWHCFLLKLLHIRCLPLFLTVVYKEQSKQHDSKKNDYDR